MSGSVGGNRLGKKRERVENGEGMGKMQTGMSVSVVL